MREVRNEVWPGACALIYPDRRITWETDVQIVDDWRDTVYGRVNFGETIILGSRQIVTTIEQPKRSWWRWLLPLARSPAWR